MKKLFTYPSGLLVLLLYSCLTCFANQSPLSSSSSNSPSKRAYYLTENAHIWKTFPKKPELGSSIDQADLLITLSAQASRDKDQKNEALRDQEYSIKLITDVIDSNFETKYPDVFQVLLNADIDSNFTNTIIKKANARLRPFVQHPILVFPLFKIDGFSYPSGHASGTQLQARILAKLFPQQEDALLKRVRQIADARVVAGVHYASDTEAGLALGDLVFTQIEAQAQFQKDLNNAVTKDHLETEAK